MARKTKEEAAETREKILDAAISAFSDKGVGNCSLEDIAEAAGVTRGAVYWHFKNKLDLFSALHQRAYKCVTDMLADDGDEPSRDPLLQLENICIENLTELCRDDQKKRLFSIFMLKCDYSGDMAALLADQNQRKCEKMPLIASFFEKAIQRGHISRRQDPVLLAMSLSCFISGIYNEYLRDPDSLDLDTHIIPMVKNYFDGLRS